MYSVISVIVDSLPGNTKNRELTCSWTARLRLVHSWAAPWKSEFGSQKEKFFLRNFHFLFGIRSDQKGNLEAGYALPLDSGSERL